MYECNVNDRQELESIQNEILERIQYLRQRDLPLIDDFTLEEYYSLNSEIQNCILNYHTFSPITLGVVAGIGTVICLSYYFRIWKKRKQTTDGKL